MNYYSQTLYSEIRLEEYRILIYYTRNIEGKGFVIQGCNASIILKFSDISAIDIIPNLDDLVCIYFYVYNRDEPIKVYGYKFVDASNINEHILYKKLKENKEYFSKGAF
jgi:hypothetical protein